MSVQCHFLSTTLYKKKKSFFKLTLVPIATEMSLNIKRLQTLAASSVVDCTACLVHGRMGGGARVERGGASHTHPWGRYRDSRMHSNLRITVSYFWAEKKYLFMILKSVQLLRCGCGSHDITKRKKKKIIYLCRTR